MNKWFSVCLWNNGFRSNRPEVLCKRSVLKISQNSQENFCATVSILIMLRKRLMHKCLSVNFAKILTEHLFHWTSPVAEYCCTYLRIRHIFRTQDFSNVSLKLCLMVCLISKLISWSDIAFDMNTAMVSFKSSNLTFKCSNLNIQLRLTWTL